MVFLKDQRLFFAFLIYNNDLSSISKVLSFYLFADDTNVYLSFHDLFSLQKIINRELKQVKNGLMQIN